MVLSLTKVLTDFVPEIWHLMATFIYVKGRGKARIGEGKGGVKASRNSVII